MLLIVIVSAGGCAASPLPEPAESVAIFISGYDVPQPDSIPFTKASERHEYLRHYHIAYLTVMWSHYWGSSTITPESDHWDAAIAGHRDGEDDALNAKAKYWQQRGRNVHWRPGPVEVKED
ncbi:MAG: hypothetical protein CMJ49_02190 [Planctomycetaceae bacterium]|nr:hypothetical protein [Planctomycetaceae bacterium]